jgi:hypothetical protein
VSGFFLLKFSYIYLVIERIRNAKRISIDSWESGFALSFCFESSIYVEVISIFKVKNEDKISCQEFILILYTLLIHISTKFRIRLWEKNTPLN